MKYDETSAHHSDLWHLLIKLKIIKAELHFDLRKQPSWFLVWT